MAGRMAAAERLGYDFILPPATTALGAILSHITGGANAETFQPMNINFGLFPEIDLKDPRGRPIRGTDRKKAMTSRALNDLDQWLKSQIRLAA